jgi:DNA replication protein DnaC
MMSLAESMAQFKRAGFIPPEHKDVSFDCPIHGRQEYKTFKTVDGWREPYCPECVKEKARNKEIVEGIKSDARQTAADISRALGIAQPLDMALATFEQYRVENADQGRVLEICRRFADRFLYRELQRVEARKNGDQKWREKNSTGLFLSGNFGTGKTHLGYAILNALSDLGIPGFYLRAPDFFDRMNDRTSGISVLQVLDCIASVPCLVLDEIGVQSWTEAERKRIYQVVDGRMQAGRPTVYITNLDSAELARCLSARVMDRIVATTVPLSFTWDSHRKRQRPGSDRF